ncbi:MAG: ECF transporter S component [Lachnospiraceae bacterium]|nr:ECF transporter S component [Lachnospiraceae bacterium]
MNTKTWKLNDIILTAMICIVFGVIYLGAVYLIGIVDGLFAFTGLSKLGTELIFGVWLMAATFAGYVIQKPGVAIVAEVIAAVIEVLLGNWFGPMVIVAGIIQGLGAEIVFAAFKYRRFQGKVMYLAAIGSCITSFLWSFVRSGYLQFSIGVLVIYFLIRLVSSLLFAGLICKKVGDGMAKTGLLKSYGLGRNSQ